MHTRSTSHADVKMGTISQIGQKPNASYQSRASGKPSVPKKYGLPLWEVTNSKWCMFSSLMTTSSFGTISVLWSPSSNRLGRF